MNNFCLIIGAGKTGISAYNFLLRVGYMPIFYDDNKFKNIEYVKQNIKMFEFCIVSPGICDEHFLVKQLKANNVPILSATEIYYLLREIKNDFIIGITGTNGKTTVTSMIGEVLGCDAFVCGNIGEPWMEKTGQEKYSVIELSSFELNRTDKFTPNIMVYLNIAPDHIDYHGSFENYKKAKFKPLKNFNKNNIVVYNAQDEILKDYIEPLNVTKYYFSINKHYGNGVFLNNNNDVVFVCNGTETILCNIAKLNITSEHNLLNVLAVCLCLHLAGINGQKIVHELSNYSYFDFRFQKIGSKLPFSIINDSKATNVAATIAALKACTKNVVLILGGQGKAEKYDKIFSFSKKLSLVVIYGQASKEIERAAKENNFQNYCVIKDFCDAVKYAAKNVKKEEILLLSPACASYDQFLSYKERGEVFNKIIKELEDN